MSPVEMKQANSIHAIFDIMVMHHSVESVLDTYELTINDLRMASKNLEEKLNEYISWTKSHNP